MIPSHDDPRRRCMTALLALAGGFVTLLVLAAMVVLVPRGTERLRRRRTSAPESQGAELSPEDEAS